MNISRSQQMAFHGWLHNPIFYLFIKNMEYVSAFMVIIIKNLWEHHLHIYVIYLIKSLKILPTTITTAYFMVFLLTTRLKESGSFLYNTFRKMESSLLVQNWSSSIMERMLIQPLYLLALINSAFLIILLLI